MNRARAEWDRLHSVMMHRPGIEMFFGLLEPYAFLYERAFNLSKALVEHEHLEYTLKSEFHIQIHRLKESLVEAFRSDAPQRRKLIDRSLEMVKFEGRREDIDRSYGRLEKNVEEMDPEFFFDVLLLNPTVRMKKGKGVRVILPYVTEKVPLSNLCFTRDQQALGDRGLIIGRMSKPQRRRETLVTGLVLEALGVKIAGRVDGRGTFEGGDFIPAKEFAIIGMGDRTNRNGVLQVLEKGLGFDEVAVVHQPTHPLAGSPKPDPMITMHLDTYFNIAGDGIAVGCRPLLERAKVEVYHRRSPGEYASSGSGGNLYEYMRKKDFHIIDISTLEQLCFASNFLTIKDNTILAIEVDRLVEKVLKNLQARATADPARYKSLYVLGLREAERLRSEGGFFPHRREVYYHDIEAIPIVLQNITGGYGGAHCLTCPLTRS